MTAPKNPVTRYVIVHRITWRGRSIRVMVYPALGRHTYRTRRFAEAVLESSRASLLRREDVQYATLEILGVECHPESHAPRTGQFFECYVEPPDAMPPLPAFGRCDGCKAYGRHSVDTLTTVPICTSCRRKATRPSL